MTLLLIGYWKASLNDEYPFPQQAEADLPADTRSAVISHLEAREPLEQYRGYSYCRYGCPGHNGSAELSDGVFIWPDGLAHYVREHGVSLPPEFVAHATSSDRRERLAVRAREESEDVDSSLWLRWAAERTPDWLAAAIDEAKAAGAQRKAAFHAVAAEQLTLAEGLANTKCLTAGCHQRALTAKAFCAACLLQIQDELSVESSEIDAEELARVTAFLVSRPDASARVRP